MAYTEEQKVIKTIKKLSPAVVSITITKYARKVYLSPLGKYFFESIGEKVETAGGSGFIVSDDGLVITNRHVISDPNAEYTAILNDGRQYDLEILVSDVINDIAILKMIQEKGKKKKFKTAKLGNSKDLKLGQKVIAIGNVLGLYENTASLGIVSGLKRKVTATDATDGSAITLKGVIQTDAAINPGNSGGPLIDLKGKVIGVNFAEVLGAENIGFAIPIHRAKQDLADYRKYGRVMQPFLGVRTIALNPQLKEQFDLPVDYGVMILRNHPLEKAIIPGSPAEKAGLKEGDIIIKIDGKKIVDEDVFTEAIHKHKVGEKIELRILRKDKYLTKKIELGERR